MGRWRGRVGATIIFVSALAGDVDAASPAASRPDCAEDKHGTFSVVHENDMFNQTDRGYTAGQRIAWVTPPHSKEFVNWLPLAGSWCKVRTEYALNQAIFTPTDTARVVPDPLDR